MKNNQDNLNILIKLSKKKNITQRKLSSELGFSLGKLNYCINSLKQKGLIKIENFTKNNNKINYLYVLTPKGISKKIYLTLLFMKKKLSEYEELKNELDKKNGF